MTEAFLMRDPSLADCWEWHREGLFGAPLVTSRFPAGLVLEVLCARGHDLRGAVDGLLRHCDANRYRYFDHPACDSDSDTVGLCLRLAPYGGGTAATTSLSAVLQDLERDVADLGRVPVWIRDWERHGATPPPAMRLGEHCGTVEAHLLTGLLANPREEHRATLHRGAADLLRRVGEVGLAANVNYPNAFALSTFFRLLAYLRVDGLSAALGGAPRAAQVALEHALEHELKEIVSTPQGAALRVTACFRAGEPQRVPDGLIEQILKRQRYDGSWLAEPFAATPNRGSAVTWYASSTLTTALCYEALQLHAQFV